MDTKAIVKAGYAAVAKEGCGCGCKAKRHEDIAKSIGYSASDLALAPEANLGLGCGNPLALAAIKPGDTVVDLGSGAGFDSFLAHRKVGPTGKVIGIDMTPEMVARATENAKKYHAQNVEFKLGDIEQLPLDGESADVVISNCVINLAPNKAKVFAEAFRVLRSGGRFYLSDIVLLKELSPEQKNDHSLLVGCVAGALKRDDYIALVKTAGFSVTILDEDREISKEQYGGIPLESLKLEAVKPALPLC